MGGIPMAQSGEAIWGLFPAVGRVDQGMLGQTCGVSRTAHWC